VNVSQLQVHTEVYIVSYCYNLQCMCSVSYIFQCM